MRTAFVCVALSGAFCVMAQDPAVPPDQSTPAPSASEQVRWTPAPGKLHAKSSTQPGKVCAVRLLEMPIPKDRKFTMRTTHPPKIDQEIFAEPPAPACPKAEEQER